MSKGRVFISSVMAGYDEYREAARRAVNTLDFTPTMAEDFAGSEQTPQQACLAGVRDADIVVVLVGDRYGYAQSGGKSATHEEFIEARDSKPVLAFVHEGVDTDEPLLRFRREVEDWARGRFAPRYTDADELEGHVIRALAEHMERVAGGTVSDEDLLGRLEARLVHPRRSSSYGAAGLTIGVACGPTQDILRPSAMEDQDLWRSIQQLAMFGQRPVVDVANGADAGIDANGDLVVGNDSESIHLSPLADVVVRQPVADRRFTGSGSVGIRGDLVYAKTAAALGFAADLLDHLDPTHRLTQVAIGVTLTGAEHQPWVEESNAEASSWTIPVRSDPTDAPIVLQPPVRSRPVLRRDVDALAEDLTTLLRRRFS